MMIDRNGAEQLLVCEHDVQINKPCIKCCMQRSLKRLRQIADNKDRASIFEREMLNHDIRLFNEMLLQGKQTL